MNYDLNMSPFGNEACSSCHTPYAAFSGPIPSVNLTTVAYPGTVRFRAAKRTAQRYTYSPKFRALQYKKEFGRVATIHPIVFQPSGRAWSTAKFLTDMGCTGSGTALAQEFHCNP